MAEDKTLTPAQKKQRDLLAAAKSVLEKNNGDISRLTGEQRQALELEYGYAYSLISSDASLRRIFSEAVRTGMTPQAFEIAVRNSDWAKKFDASARKFEMAESFVSKGKATNATGTDHLRRVKDVADAVKRQAMVSAGVTVTDEGAEATARRILRSNYDDWQTVLPRFVRTEYVRNDALAFGGEAADQELQIRNFARQMGVQLSDNEIGTYVDQIFDETNTLTNIQAKIRNDAGRLFPQFKDRIDSGATVDDIIFPYRRMMASLLEVDEEQLNLLDPKTGKMDPLMQRALYATDAKGNPAAMSLTEFRKAVRKDERWQYTKNATDEAATLTKDILRKFGAGI